VTRVPASRDDAFSARIAAIERRLNALDAARTINGTTIDEPGSLQVRDKNGHLRMFMGVLADNIGIGLELYRADGSKALTCEGFSGDPTFHETIRLWDRAGNVLFEDDETSGVGLSRPYIPIPDAYQTATNPTTTTNIFDLAYLKQHPHVEVGVTAYCTVAGATGLVELFDSNNSVVLASAPITSTASAYALSGAVSGPHLNYQGLNIRVRRLTGTGDVQAVLMYAIGKG
jgi:hypothetical protein